MTMKMPNRYWAWFCIVAVWVAPAAIFTFLACGSVKGAALCAAWYYVSFFELLNLGSQATQHLKEKDDNGHED